jgi:hypothetical protein
MPTCPGNTSHLWHSHSWLCSSEAGGSAGCPTCRCCIVLKCSVGFYASRFGLGGTNTLVCASSTPTLPPQIFLLIIPIHPAQSARDETHTVPSASKQVEGPRNLQGAHHAQAFLRCLTFRCFTFLAFRPTRRPNRCGSIRARSRRCSRANACRRAINHFAFCLGASDRAPPRHRHAHRLLPQQNFQ